MSFEDELRSRLRRLAASVEFGPEPDPGAPVRGRPDRLPRQIGTVAAALAIATAGVLVAWYTFENSGESGPPESPSPAAVSASPAAPTSSPETSLSPTATDGLEPAFPPPTRIEGDSVVMSLAFPDGTSAELWYEPDLRLETLGIRRASSSGYLAPGGHRCCGRTIVVRYGLPEALGDIGNAPVMSYEGVAQSVVELWPRAGESGEPSAEYWLVYRFGAWTVGVWDGGYTTMTDEQRALWAKSLQGEVREDGYLVLRAAAPLTLADSSPEGESPATPELQIGDTGRSYPGAVLVRLGPCSLDPESRSDIIEIAGKFVSRSDGFASWCVPDGRMTVTVLAAWPGGSTAEAFIDAVIEGVEVHNVVYAPRPAR